MAADEDGDGMLTLDELSDVRVTTTLEDVATLGDLVGERAARLGALSAGG